MHCACRFSPSHRSSRRCAVNSVSPALRSGYPVGHLVRRGGHDRFAPGRPAGCRGSGRCRVAAGCLGLGAARRHAGCYDSLRRNRRNGCGRSGDPAGNAGAGRPLAAASHRSWHRYLHEWIAGRRNPAGCTLPFALSFTWRELALPIVAIALLVMATAPRDGRTCQHAGALVARLARPRHLATGTHFRRQQRGLFRQQCLFARL